MNEQSPDTADKLLPDEERRVPVDGERRARRGEPWGEALGVRGRELQVEEAVVEGWEVAVLPTCELPGR